MSAPVNPKIAVVSNQPVFIYLHPQAVIARDTQEICARYLKGYCPDGYECKFKHKVYQPEVANSDPKIYKAFLKNGFCQSLYASQCHIAGCKFKHINK